MSNKAFVGLILFSSGVENGVLKPMETIDIINIVVGLLYIVIALLGYVGASAENFKLLRTYIVVMSAKSVSNVTRLVRWGKSDAASHGFYAAMIGDTIITMVSVLLSLTLGVAAESG